MNSQAFDYTLFFVNMNASQHKAFKRAYNVLRRAGVSHDNAFQVLYEARNPKLDAPYAVVAR